MVRTKEQEWNYTLDINTPITHCRIARLMMHIWWWIG